MASEYFPWDAMRSRGVPWDPMDGGTHMRCAMGRSMGCHGTFPSFLSDVTDSGVPMLGPKNCQHVMPGIPHMVNGLHMGFHENCHMDML